MIKLCVIGIVLASIAGCGKTDVTASGKDEGKADLEALAKLKDELCACKDAVCGRAVEEKLTAKTKEMDATYASSHNKNILHHAMETELAAKECLTNLK
jgi:hypothetical protein